MLSSQLKISRGIISCTSCLRRALPIATTTTTTISTATAITSNIPILFNSPARQRFNSTDATVIVDAPRNLETEGPEDPSIAVRKQKQRLEKAVYKHLEHLEDPWKIGQYVERALERDAFDEALLLVQKASVGKQLVVSWNHLIDYELRRDNVRQAMRLFNDMKKRQQLPNVRTFTILFRGLAKSSHPKYAVTEAVKHYNVLINDTRLEPNSIHLNAVLNVCARAGDLDSLFLITDTINESTRSPTAYTYTTILNALRHSCLNELIDLPREQQTVNIEKLISRAKGLWTEVIDKWHTGRLVIDEALVCSMARLLLLAPKREDKKQVLDLLEQTMSIPNLVKNPDADPYADQLMLNVGTTPKPVPSNTIKASPKTRVFYAVPNRNTLAVVLTVLASSRETTSGIKYWNLMLRHYGIVPDPDNWLRLLGLLKVSKASAHASSILELMPPEMDAKPFRIATETCIRDNINPNVIQNSVKVLDAMLKHLKVPDLHALRLHLRVALVSHFHLRAQALQGPAQAAEARRLYGIQITEALARLWEPYKQTHYHYFKASSNPEKKLTKQQEADIYNSKREVIALARLMYSAFNKVINEAMLPESELKDVRPVAAKINREVQKFYATREEHEPKLPSALRKSDQQVMADAGIDLLPDQEHDNKDDDEQHDGDGLGLHKQGADFIWNTLKEIRPQIRDKSISDAQDTYQRRSPRQYSDNGTPRGSSYDRRSLHRENRDGCSSSMKRRTNNPGRREREEMKKMRGDRGDQGTMTNSQFRQRMEGSMRRY